MDVHLTGLVCVKTMEYRLDVLYKLLLVLLHRVLGHLWVRLVLKDSVVAEHTCHNVQNGHGGERDVTCEGQRPDEAYIGQRLDDVMPADAARHALEEREHGYLQIAVEQAQRIV